MNTFLRKHLTTMLVAFVTAAVAAGGPAIAEVIADYAKNADKVDGRHAIGAGASLADRKAKLVATDATTGRLPNNIIARAPDSAKLNGFSHAKLRTLQMPVHGSWISGGASLGYSGVHLAPDSTSDIRFNFVVPPDHTADAPIYADIVYMELGAAACSWYVETAGLTGPTSDGSVGNGAWYTTESSYSGAIEVASGAQNDVFKKSFRWPFASPPGNVIQFGLSRVGANAADSCGNVTIMGMMFRY